MIGHSNIEPASAFMIVDIISRVLSTSDDIEQLSEWITSEIREITGARLVLIVSKHEEHQFDILHINPERKAGLCNTEEISAIICQSFLYSEISEMNYECDNSSIVQFLQKQNYPLNLIIPLVAQHETLGSIIALGLPEKNNLETLKYAYRNLTALLGLVFKNASLINKQENTIKERTKELIEKQIILQEQNIELEQSKQLLEENEIRLKAQNEEYAALNEELHQINEQLFIAKQKAEESDRLKTAFLQNMSHEIRTPLNAISGFSGFLSNPDLSDEKRKSFVQIIQNSSNQLISIVSDILTISSLETKQEKVNISTVCMNSLIIELLAIFKQQAMHQNISLYAKQQLNDKQSEIHTDKTKITQILSNLLSNALKFTHEGFIEFGYTLQNNNLEFYVKDTGIGIKPEMHEKIFERFRQADLSISKLYGGTGLGLAISKAFVELLGGKIWVQSESEKGSTFYFTIPYTPANENCKSTIPCLKNNHTKTIIVAEDEEYNFLFIEELLIDFDLKLIHTKDGKETVEMIKSNQNIDLILMDIKMPIMDGHTAAILIKELKADLPIIAQSAYALEHEITKYEGIFDDYITKPIKADDLKQKVMKFLKIE